MKHRQFGLLLGVVMGGTTFIVVNCSLDHWDKNGTCLDLNIDGQCDIYEHDAGAAGNGGAMSSSGGSGTGGSIGGSAGAGGASGGNGGFGGTILVGGGGAGGTGGQGGGVNPVLCGPDQVPIPATGLVICWHIDLGHDIPGTTLGLGGLIQEPGNPTVAQSPFPGCVTSTPSVNTLVCPLGNLTVGTDFVFDPYATDGSSTYWRCDVNGLPGSKCFGEYWIYVDGVEISTFVDPPTGRWTYDTAGAYLRLVYTDPG